MQQPAHQREIMRAVLAAFLVTLAVMFVGASPAQAAEAAGTAGIRVHDGRLVEATGSDLVLRGVNYDFISYPNENGSFAAIKAAGANAVRVPLGIGHQWPLDGPHAVATVVSLCRCGQSAKKPFCDSAHKTCAFDSIVAAFDLEPPAPKPAP